MASKPKTQIGQEKASGGMKLDSFLASRILDGIASGIECTGRNGAKCVANNIFTAREAWSKGDWDGLIRTIRASGRRNSSSYASTGRSNALFALSSGLAAFGPDARDAIYHALDRHAFPEWVEYWNGKGILGDMIRSCDDRPPQVEALWRLSIRFGMDLEGPTTWLMENRALPSPEFFERIQAEVAREERGEHATVLAARLMAKSLEAEFRRIRAQSAPAQADPPAAALGGL